MSPILLLPVTVAVGGGGECGIGVRGKRGIDGVRTGRERYWLRNGRAATEARSL